MVLTLDHTFIVIGGVALSVLGVILVRKFVPFEKLHENNDFTGFAYSVIGLFYGIYLAFTVVVVWQQYEDAEEDATTEAVHLNAMWRDAQGLAPQDRDRIQTAIERYVQSVICYEWPSLEANESTEERTVLAYEAVWQAYYAARPDPNDPVQSGFYTQGLDEMNDFSMARRMRLLDATDALPPVMWWLLIGGAIGTIVFTWFYATRYAFVQVTVTAFLSIIIIYSVVLVAGLQHPFGGEVHVTPDAFESLRKSHQARRAALGMPVDQRRCP